MSNQSKTQPRPIFPVGLRTLFLTDPTRLNWQPTARPIVTDIWYRADEHASAIEIHNCLTLEVCLRAL